MCRLRLLKISGRNLCLRHGPPAFPDTLRYLSWNSYPLKSISTNFIADKLVALVMRESQLEKLWEGAPNLDNLKRIDLIGSMQLTQVPDLSRAPKIESVFLNGCESLTEVPSYFQHLTKLRELSLLCCTSLSKLSRLPKSLTTLRVFTHPFAHRIPCCASSSKLERFPKISGPMEFLEHLQIEYAAIKELPLSINNLTGLKALSLSVCRNLEFLPDSIHSLSSLQELDISFCQKLESLPVLPSSLSILDARCCTSLKTVSSSIPLVKQNWDDLFSGGYKCEDFLFIGCEMLDENARRVLMDEALFRILRSATIVSKYGSDVRGFIRSFWPGNEIPWWFSHKSDESSICIKLPHPDSWYDSSGYLGLAFCLVLEFHHPMLTLINYNWAICGESVYMFPNGDSWKQRRYWFIDPQRDRVFSNYPCAFDGSLTNSEYLCVFVDNTYGESLRSNKWEEFGKYIKAEEVSRCDDTNGIIGFTTPVTASFSFSFLESHRQFSKIKKCGVHLLYRQEAERFGYVRQVDQSESSGEHEAVFCSDQDEEDEEEDDNGGRESDSDEECREAIHFESDDQEEA
ncbi:hypothetical protein TIFTF001_035735 [Ficus carica]|uniref:C-JID domain-containing protein n=1 Tax=Ficus carica TaxID=3494 RepID=A0AA88J9Y3_FICCA|nr:hypothetical protein TIFTF001_035735 [Ficus carica]